MVKTLGGSTQLVAHYRWADRKADNSGETPKHQATRPPFVTRSRPLTAGTRSLRSPHPSQEWITDVLADSDDARHRIANAVQLPSCVL